MLRPQQTISRALLLAFLLGLLATGSAVEAADDPSIQGELRSSIQNAMQDLIARNTVDGVYWHYDAVAGELLGLRLAELHEGIVHKGSYYVSCADFKDEDGNVYDLDFLVLPAGDEPRAVQALVHKSGGVKRPYHLESK